MLLKVRGTAFSVAECGEQFAWLSAAWLCAAMHRSPHSWGGQCTPVIKNYSVASQTAEPGSTEVKHYGSCQISFQFRQDHTTAQGQRRWHGLLSDPLAVEGFPIPRRPESCSGLELSLDMITRLLEAQSIVMDKGKVCIKGLRATLSLSTRVENVFVWNLAFDTSKENELQSRDISTASKSVWSCEIPLLQRARHIISDCQGTSTPSAVAQILVSDIL